MIDGMNEVLEGEQVADDKQDVWCLAELDKAKEEFFGQIALTRADPGAPPETFGEYKKSESSSGVINMIDEMIKDMKDEMAEAKRDEEEGQKDYEETMNDAATKRADDSKLMITKEGEKAEETTKLEELKESKRTKKGQHS